MITITFISVSPINKLWGRVFITGLRQQIIGSFTSSINWSVLKNKLTDFRCELNVKACNYSFLMLEPVRETFIMTFCWILLVRPPPPSCRLISPDSSQSFCKYFDFSLLWDQWTILLSWRYFTTNKCIDQWELEWSSCFARPIRKRYSGRLLW